MKGKCFRRAICLVLVAVLIAGLIPGCEKKQEPEKKKEETAEVDRVVEPLIIETEEEEQEAVEVPEKAEAVEETQPEEPVAEILGDLNGQIQAAVAERQALGEQWAVYVQDLTTDNYASAGNVRMESASLIKLFTAVTVFQYMNEMTAQERYSGEILELMRSMICVSDNAAANELVRRLGGGDAAAGMEKVNSFCRNYGFAETHMGRLMLDFDATDDNYTSVENCGRLLGMIYRKELAGSDTILGFMKEQERIGKIPAGLPAGVVSANKTGELDDVENDAAVVFAGTKDYVICVMSGNLVNPGDARSKIIELSGLVYQYMQSH